MKEIYEVTYNTSMDGRGASQLLGFFSDRALAVRLACKYPNGVFTAHELFDTEEEQMNFEELETLDNVLGKINEKERKVLVKNGLVIPA